MDAFDDEPNAGGGYDDVFPIPIWDTDGVSRRIVIRFRRAFARVAIVLEQRRGNRAGNLVRYDDAHGRFHRHEPGWPEPSDRIAAYLDAVAARHRAAFAIAEIKVRYTEWESAIFVRTGR